VPTGSGLENDCELIVTIFFARSPPVTESLLEASDELQQLQALLLRLLPHPGQGKPARLVELLAHVSVCAWGRFFKP